MTIENFEKEIQSLHKEFKIIKSQHLPTATVFFATEPIFTIPREHIYDEIKDGYGIDMPSGNFQRHRTRKEAYEMATSIIHRLKTDPDYADALLGTGAYSATALKSPLI